MSFYGRIVYVLLAIVTMAVTTSCNKQYNAHADNLLSVKVLNSNTINKDDYNQRLQKLLQANKDTDNLMGLLSELWITDKAHASLIAINRLDNPDMDAYAAIVITDRVPDDDSVSGYRYDIKLNRKPDNTLEIIEIRQSWRCWKGRGHRDFGVEACS